MKHLILPDNDERRLIFYLSMEEFAAREMDGEAFFLWQVSPTVIFGRNQLMEAEVNVPFCREHGIKMFRRKSGGGCVYSDWGNIMVSYIVKGEDVTATFNTFLQRLASALRGIEIEADVMLKGTRVDGVYTADPEKDPAAEKFDEITFDEVYRRNLKVMDMTAFTLCRENGLRVIVFDMDTPGNLEKVLAGEKIGTLVKL